MTFVHLHNHSHYSLLDGLARPEDYVRIAKEQGAKAVGLTDHGVMYGAVEFYEKAKEADIKPILGCEVYITAGSRFDRAVEQEGERYFHLTLLAENNKGYQNLLKLTTSAHLEGYYYKPRIDFELLRDHHEGLIALSGCLMGEISRAALGTDDLEKAAKVLDKYLKIFGRENFYLEIQDHPEIHEQVLLNRLLKDLSSRSSVALVATNDCHYAKKEDNSAHDVLICIQTQRIVDDENRMKFNGDFSMRDEKELEEAFSDFPDAVKNTLEIAERCKVEMKFGRNLLPKFETPDNQSPEEYLRELCLAGLKTRYGDKPSKEACERLDFELSVINKMGFDSYFLIVRDFVKYAKDNGIIVGPGRGSAAGSLIAYCLEITDMDPLKYNLLFERFLNPERVSMPDIDIDFADISRDRVLDYVIQKYGQDHVAQIITFGTMAPRAAVRDAGRVLGFSYPDVDRIAKMVPPPVQGRHIPLLTSIKEDVELREAYNNEEQTKTVLDMAIKLEGTVRHAGTHACAVVISPEPLVNYTALQKAAGNNDGIVTQLSMKPIEKIGLLKMDFLGLKNLTIMDTALKIIERTKKKQILISEVPLNDKKTFTLLQEGLTTGVFQLESAGMKRYLKQLKPNCFEDIIAMVSLYRPGPMEWIPNYIKGKHGEKKVEYLHESLEPILKETYGIAVYQEQILQIAQVFAGFTLGEADLLRRAIGKKIPAELQAQRQKFIDGAQKLKHPKKLCVDIFENVVEPFAAYGFNKSHAACYAMIAYQTAYLKANFPAEFMAALLSSDADNTDRVAIEINDCESMGIKVLPPSVNESLRNFTVVDDFNIRFGLQAIKGLGEGPVREIITVRGDKKFVSLEDFASRVPAKILNKKSLQSLALSGALDELGERNLIASNVEEIGSFAKSVQTSKSNGQMDIFGLMDDGDKTSKMNLAAVAEAGYFEKLKWERDYLGMFVSQHPLDGLGRFLARKSRPIATLSEKVAGQRVLVAGLFIKMKKITTKSGKPMMYGTLEDATGNIEVVVFPKTFEANRLLFSDQHVMFLQGKLDFRRQEIQFICEQVKKVSLDMLIAKAKESNLYFPEEKVVRKIKSLTVDEQIESENIDNDEEAAKALPFIIKVKSNLEMDKLKELKELLHQNLGESVCEIHIPEGRSLKRLKVPFGVKVSESLKEEVNVLLGNV